jgi:hypothetical protein
MSDAFGVESHTSVMKRSVKSVESKRFSPSYGVHQGLIPDPNWPPAHFPDNNVAMQRKDRRVSCRFTLDLDGRRAEVLGDVSKGGVMFLLPVRVPATIVAIEVRGVRAQVTILSASQHGAELSHHARYIDAAEGARVWQALLKA